MSTGQQFNSFTVYSPFGFLAKLNQRDNMRVNMAEDRPKRRFMVKTRYQALWKIEKKH